MAVFRRGFVALALVAACTQAAPTAERPAPSTPPATMPPVTPSPEATAPPHPVSLQTLMQKEYDGRDLRLGRVLSRNSAYTRYHVTYRSENLKISGIMNVPAGDGPFPAMVLAHGYIDPDVYVNGQGLAREQDHLAREGYVVLHTDYRNHAQSSDDPAADMGLRLGYTVDVLNAVMALKRSGLPYLDAEKIGVLGRSMGGGVTMNAAVVRPDLVGAVVLYASVSSDTVDNFNKWFRRSPERRALAQEVAETYGSPEENPEFWRNISPRTFFDRIAVPVVVHHGSEDDTCPIRWAEETVQAMRSAGKDVRYFVYEGEGHAFYPLWRRSIRRTVAYLDAIFEA